MPCAFIREQFFAQQTTDHQGDDLGLWKNNCVNTVFFHASVSDLDVIKVEKCSTGTDAVYQLKRVYKYHGTNPSLHKITASIIGKLPLKKANQQFCLQ